MKVTLKDGSVKEYAQPMAVIDIAKDISEEYDIDPKRSASLLEHTPALLRYLFILIVF